MICIISASLVGSELLLFDILAMSDSAYDYPDDLQLKPSIQKQVEYATRQVIVTQATQKKQHFYFDKDTFDYNFMFMDVQPSSSNFMNSFDIKKSRSIQVRKREKKVQQQSVTIHEDSQSQKSQENINEQEEILAVLKQEEQIVNKDIQIQQEPQISNIQQPSISGSLMNTSQNLNDESRKVQKPQLVESSQIDNLSAQFEQGYSKQEQKSEEQPQKQQLSQTHLSFIKKQVQIDGILQISQIHANKTAEQLMDLLNKQYQKDSDGQVIENKQNLQLKLERQEKISQMKALPFQTLVFKLNTVNCKKISIKSLVDFDNSPLVINKPKPTTYLQVLKRKIDIPMHQAENIIWQIAYSKILMNPLELSLKCYSCGAKRKAMTSDQSCFALCSNSQCTKQITVQFVDICLTPENM